jgi:hypothetical protein
MGALGLLAASLLPLPPSPNGLPSGSLPRPWVSDLSLSCPLALIFTVLKNKQARCWWLTPVILATQEAEIRKLQSKASPGK